MARGEVGQSRWIEHMAGPEAGKVWGGRPLPAAVRCPLGKRTGSGKDPADFFLHLSHRAMTTCLQMKAMCPAMCSVSRPLAAAQPLRHALPPPRRTLPVPAQLPSFPAHGGEWEA